MIHAAAEHGELTACYRGIQSAFIQDSADIGSRGSLHYSGRYQFGAVCRLQLPKRDGTRYGLDGKLVAGNAYRLFYAGDDVFGQLNLGEFLADGG